jgi:uncharacterized lipoprotein NlpE involved in copper resistance
MSRSDWSKAKKHKKKNTPNRTPLFECKDREGNNFTLNINWDQGRENVKKKLEEKEENNE